METKEKHQKYCAFSRSYLHGNLIMNKLIGLQHGLRIGLFVIFLGILSTSCQKDEKIYIEPHDDLELFAHTKVIDSQDLEQMVHFLDTTDFTFTVQQEFMTGYNLNQGDVMVSDAGLGFLRKLDSIVDIDEQAILYTSQATFEDAIKQGSVSYRQKLSPQMIDSVEYHFDNVKLSKASLKDGTTGTDDTIVFDFDVDLADYVSLTGDFSLLSEIVFEMDISSFLRLRHVHFGFENQTHASLTAELGSSVGFERSVSIATVYFTPIVIPTVVPIVITPVFTINIGVDGSAQAVITTNVGQKVVYQTGIKYDRDTDWSSYDNVDNEWTYTPPNPSVDASLRAHVTPDMSMLLYGVVGAYMDASIYGKLDVDLLETPWWVLYAGYRVGLGAKATIFSVNLFDVNYPALLGSEWIIAQSHHEPPGETGIVKGVVRDAVTEQGLDNVQIEVYQDDQLYQTWQTGFNGAYQLELPSGSLYHISFTRQGYLPAEYHDVVVHVNQETQLAAVLQIDDQYSGSGSVAGRVIDAFDGGGIDDAYVVVRSGINNEQGEIVQSTSSDASGSYTFSGLQAGNYTIEATKNNFSKGYHNVVCLGGEFTDNQNVSLTPEMNEDEIRIILDWGQNPSDLDSHLTGPIAGSDADERFHIYYSNKTFYHNSELYAALDYDVVSSYGPETISIYHQTDGMYRFSVHDFSNRMSDNSYALSNSDARVRVFKGSDLIETFYVPANTEGTLWTVFELEGDNIMPVNAMSYESTPSSVTKSTDLELIKHLPVKK